jgi:hypothetical protein
MSDQLQDFPEEEFTIPNSYLDKLFEFTGDGDDGGGFILAYVTQDGRAIIQSKIGSQIVEMGLRKALERFLDDMEMGEKALSDDNQE